MAAIFVVDQMIKSTTFLLQISRSLANHELLKLEGIEGWNKIELHCSLDFETRSNFLLKFESLEINQGNGSHFTLAGHKNLAMIIS